MEIDPSASMQDMVEGGEYGEGNACGVEADRNPSTCDSPTADSDAGGMGGMMQDLAFAIPGIDEAMGFAEVMKYVRLSFLSFAGR